MKDEEIAVGRHYDQNVLAYEHDRLELHCPVEFAMTLRALSRFMPTSAKVAVDIGVGSGAYSSWLASRGIDVHLVDVSQKLLQAAVDRLEHEGYLDRLASQNHLSATELESIPSACADIILLLGPFYHLRQLDDRRRAACGAARVLKPGGVIFAAGISKLALLRDAFKEAPESGLRFRNRRLKFLEDGQLDPELAPPIGFAHLTTSAEFSDLFVDQFEPIALWGLESFTNTAQEKLLQLKEDDREAWFDILERTAPLAEALGYSDHFLYIGRRPMN
jgi:S-adenosylmethionine-dependent methyltransferase